MPSLLFDKRGATGTVEGLDHPAGSLPGDTLPCHTLDTMHSSNELIKTKNIMMPLLHIHIRLFPFMLYAVIVGSVAQFSYRLMLHALLIVARLHAFIGGSVELFSNIGESVALTTVCAKLVVRSTEL